MSGAADTYAGKCRRRPSQFALPMEKISDAKDGLDVVLGIQWLELLGSVVCDWKQLTMEFLWENQTKKLIDIDGQDIRAASLKELTKEMCPSQTLFALCFQVNQTKSLEKLHPSMRELL
ncbi:hypothetical protein Pint_33819 [Pistacia integerrima]|uniref:Uncharacterized protein n=1 Tax=Pistacia integerrima TaxID=434235 RepID=A0ACC0X4P5_9ROSI|nr:hypothetical protein Pint_33819 [Pistacia integerrima]